MENLHGQAPSHDGQPKTDRSDMQTKALSLSEWERRLLNDYQHHFPLSSAPYADLARELHVSEAEVLDALARMKGAGMVSRVGAVLRPNSVGASTLAAMAVPAERLEAVAALVSSVHAVNHNYEREHRLNLWFVVTAGDAGQLQAVLDDIADRTGIEVLSFPLVEDYHIDLGFDLRWT